MAYRIEPGESVNDALIRIAREQVGKAIAEIDDSNVDDHETVHRVRKRCKKLRGLLRAVRPALGKVYKQENACIRDAAARLSFVRDAQTLVTTLDDLTTFYADSLAPDFAAVLHAHLVSRRNELAESEMDLDGRLAQVRAVLQSAHDRAGTWQLADDGFDAVAGGLRKTYQRGRKAMVAAYRDPDAGRFHEWRKRTKYFRFQQRLLRPVWPAVVKQQSLTASELGDLLGDDHDLAILQRTLVTESAAVSDSRELQVLLALAEQRQLMLRQQAGILGKRLFAEQPDALVARFHGYWSAWQAEQQSGPDAERDPR